MHGSTLRRRHVTRVVVGLTAAGLALAGCGGDDSGGAPSSGAPLPGGGLSVAEAIETSAEPPLAVSGWVVREGDDTRLCSSYEPDADDPCGEPSLVLESDEGHESGEQVSVLGAVEGDRFVVSGTSR